ncbi:MAG: iron-siderophore ABC transporter substrate-binding protein [Actinomycetota bacterium]
MRVARVLLACLLIATACGGDPATSDPAGEGATGSGGSVEAVEPDDAVGSEDDAGASGSEADGGPFPVTIEHAFGSTTVEAEPQRVVTYGFADHSYVLALGVVPVGLRKTFDDQSFTVWPWAQAALGGAEVTLLGSLEPSFETIAALEPDLIVAVNADVDDQVYGLLSAIAPTIARGEGVSLQGTPWREMTEITGRALGRVDEAQAVIDDLEDRFAAVQTEHPDFVGSTASVVFYTASTGRLGTYSADNNRYQFLAELGFDPPPVVVEAGAGDILVELGEERIDLIDADVVIWNPADEVSTEEIRTIPTRAVALPAAAEGREVIGDLFLSAALTEASPPSLLYALERLVPELSAAIDGDLATPAPSAVGLYETGAPAAPTAAEQAALDAWEAVLSPDATDDERRPHIADYDDLAETVIAGVAAGDALGGVTITPTRATIDGDIAIVTFDASLGDATTSDLITTLDLIDGVWVARRAEVCLYIGFVGVECPPAG